MPSLKIVNTDASSCNEPFTIRFLGESPIGTDETNVLECICVRTNEMNILNLGAKNYSKFAY